LWSLLRYFMTRIVPVLFTLAALTACPPTVPAEATCAVELPNTPIPSTNGGHLADGRWTNSYTVIDEQSQVLAIPVNEDTLRIAGEICCYCNGTVNLDLPDWVELGEYAGTTLDSPACDLEPAQSVLGQSEASGEHDVVITRQTVQAVQRDADGVCITGVYEHFDLAFVDCETGEKTVPFSDYRYVATGTLPSASCADQ
jgi:hypothetical protein